MLASFRSTYRLASRRFASTPTSVGGRAPLAFRQRIRSFRQYAPRRPQQRIDWQRTWQGTQQKRGYRQPLNYRRFQQTRGFFYAWAARPTFYYEVGGITAVVVGAYVYNLEEVPVSGRRRFNIISPETEVSMASSMYQQVLQEYQGRILPPHSKEYRQVQRVLNRLIPHSGLEGQSWEVQVIDDDQANAFVIPGGKVFVFRGILDVCGGDDGLAAVLGHEIAHNVAHHAAERMSQSAFAWPLMLLGALFGIDIGISQLFVNLVYSLPGSRSQEEEADYIGLLMMAESCYDPSAAVGLWGRMEKKEQTSGGAPPQFLSTHPSSHNRQEKIRDWLPKAQDRLEQSDCGTTRRFVGDFKQVADFGRW